MNQKVSGWFGWIGERPTRAKLPPAEQSGPKVSAVRYAERGNLMPSPFGQANRKNRKARYGRYGVR
ncbi:MAG: hypothetical protein R3261_02770 [Alphaproteobacteria bacterium]|nr:hypothetical protein [Alphaproteobacteria bacterium]